LGLHLFFSVLLFLSMVGVLDFASLLHWPTGCAGSWIGFFRNSCVFLVISITFLSLYTSSVNYFFGATVQFGLVGSKAFWHMEMHLTPCSSFPLLRKLEVYKFQRKNDNFVGACWILWLMASNFSGTSLWSLPKLGKIAQWPKMDLWYHCVSKVD
jgi:hypothetical protein